MIQLNAAKQCLSEYRKKLRQLHTNNTPENIQLVEQALEQVIKSMQEINKLLQE
ncbi:MAG: hypothetical protein H6774_02645 [Pseudomonadales bacterium]|nr:hypothetical protein [Pseudomonadales bacterium]